MLIMAFGPPLVGLVLAAIGILPPFVIALALASLLDPLVDRLQSKGLPRGVAVFAVFLMFLVVLTAGLVYLVPKVVAQVTQLITDWPGYQDTAGRFISHTMTRHRALLIRLHIPTTVGEVTHRYSSELSTLGHNAVTILLGFAGEAVKQAVWVVWLVLITLLTFLLLKDLDKIKAKWLYLLPERHRERTVGVAAAVGNVFARYLRGLIIVCTLYAIIASLVFAAFNLSYALVLGLVAGALYAIPYVGPITIATIAGLSSLLQHPDHAILALILVIITVAMNQVFDMLLTPRIVGGAVGLHPALSIMALLFGGAAFGVAGMVLAIPVAASAQVVLCEFFPQLRKPLKDFEPKRKTPPKEAKPGKKPRSAER